METESKSKRKNSNDSFKSNLIESEDQQIVIQSTQKPNPSESAQCNSKMVLLYVAILFQLAIFVTEMVVDQFLHSLLVLADAYHHLFNICNGILMVLCFKVGTSKKR